MPGDGGDGRRDEGRGKRRKAPTACLGMTAVAATMPRSAETALIALGPRQKLRGKAPTTCLVTAVTAVGTRAA